MPAGAPDGAGLPAGGATTGALWLGLETLVAGTGELTLLDKAETIGAGEAGEAAGELPAGTAGLVVGTGELALLAEPGTIAAGEAGEAAGELPAGTAGLEAETGELPEPDDGPTGTIGVDAGGAAAADGDTVIVEYTVTGVHCEAEEAPMGEFALPD